MTPKEWTEKTINDLAERKKQRERDINSYSISSTLNSVSKRNKARYGKKASKQI